MSKNWAEAIYSMVLWLSRVSIHYFFKCSKEHFRVVMVGFSDCAARAKAKAQNTGPGTMSHFRYAPGEETLSAVKRARPVDVDLPFQHLGS